MEVRAMGRQAAGVRGIELRSKDAVVGMEVIPETSHLLFATSRGYGKRVLVSDFRVAHRGGVGVRTIPVDVRNGHVIGLVRVTDESHILLIDSNGKIIRLSPQEIRSMGRQAKGVRLVRLDDTQTLSALVAFDGSNIDEPKELTESEPNKDLDPIDDNEMIASSTQDTVEVSIGDQSEETTSMKASGDDKESNEESNLVLF